MLLEKFNKSFFESPQEGQVTFYEAAPEYAEAEWSDGQESFYCELRLEKRRLYVSCACDNLEGGLFCGHLAQVLDLAYEREVLLFALKKNVAAKLLPMNEFEATPEVQKIEQDSLTPKIKQKTVDPVSQRSSLSSSRKVHRIDPQVNDDCGVELIFCLASRSDKYFLEFYWKGSGRAGYFNPQGGECAEADSKLLQYLNQHAVCVEGKCFSVELAFENGGFLRRLFEAGKLMWRGSDAKLKKISLREGDWDFEPQGMESDDGRLFISGLLRNKEDEILDFSPLAQSVDFRAGVICFYGIQGAHKLEKALSESHLEINRAESAIWAQEYLGGTKVNQQGLPDLLRYDQSVSTDDLRGRVYFSPAEFKHKNREVLQAELFWLYGEAEVADLSKDAYVSDFRNKLIHQRDRHKEKRLKDLLPALGIEWLGGGPEPGWKVVPSELPRLVEKFNQRKWQTFAEGKNLRVPRDFQVQLSSGADWLDLEGEMEFDEDTKVSLPDILKQWAEGERFVVLDDGNLGLLPEEWLKNFTALTELGEISMEGLRFHRAQSLLVEKLLSELKEIEVQFDESCLTKRLEGFAHLDPVKPSQGFLATLRPYQEQSLAWMLFMNELGLGACLADDMGLGKTVQILALLHEFNTRQINEGPYLVVAPRSLIFNWQEEVERFCPDFKVRIYAGAGRQKQLRETRKGDILLTTYGTVMRDVELLNKHDFGVCVADEAQVMKNPESMTSKTMRLVQAKFKVGMSGTPIENNLGDLWSLFEFLNPGLLGPFKEFNKIYMSPESGDQVLSALRKTVRPLMMRRHKRDVAPELPAKTEQVIYCEAGAEQRRLYDEMRDYYRQENEAGEKKPNMLAALTRLRQASCHIGLVNEEYRYLPSGKLNELMTRLEEIHEMGGKALIFSQFTRFMDIIEAQIKARSWGQTRLDGSTKDRRVPVKEFNEQEPCRFFLISLKAGGTGLNLIAAQYVFLMDPWWNPAAESQAIDRAYRIGQEKAVTAYRLVCQDSVEEKMLELQKQKSNLADAVVDRGALSGNLSRDDFDYLLK